MADRARTLLAAWEAYGGRNLEGVGTIQSKGRRVQLRDIRMAPGETNTVLIWRAGKDPDRHRPDYRITNPPLMRESSLGTRTIHGRLHIEDPLGALAEVIGRAEGSAQ